MSTHTAMTTETSGHTLLGGKRGRSLWLLILLSGVCLIGFARSGEARPKYWELIQTIYHPQANSALAHANCFTCHTAGYDDGSQPPGICLNHFGMVFKAEPVHDSQALKNIDSLDSDGDGWPNGIELRGGTLPGDAKSHPTGVAPATLTMPLIPETTHTPGAHSVERLSSPSMTGWLLATTLALLVILTGLGCILCYLNWRVLRLLSKSQTAPDVREGELGQQERRLGQHTLHTSENTEFPASRLPEVMAPSRPPSGRTGPLSHMKGDTLQRNYVVRSEINQRENNEDSFQVYDLALIPGNIGVPILALADGMGGHAHGEHASREALRKASQVLFDQLLVERSINLTALPCPIDSKTLLPAVLNALQQADTHIRRMVEVNHWGKAGSTLVLAVVMEDSAVVANLGDSPLFHYQRESGRLTQVTEDHTVAGALLRGGLISPEMAKVHEGKSRLEFFIGGAQFPKEPPLYHISLSSGDLVLLCSDGVSGSLALTQIAQILTEDYGDLERQANNLLKAALESGETDNQTLILWQHSGRSNEENDSTTTKSMPTVAHLEKN